MLERRRKIWYNYLHNLDNRRRTDLLRRGAGDLSSIKYWPDKQQSIEGQRPAVDASKQPELSQCDDDDGAKLRAMGSLVYSSSSMVDIRACLCYEKLQFSGFMSQQVSGAFSLICDKSSEGTPLSSFSMDKHAMEYFPAASYSLLQVNSLGISSSSMPWMDPTNKSFSLASSIPAPKLVSGSFSITNGSKQFYRVVHEPEGMANDHTTSINSKFADMGISGTAKESLISVERISSIPDSGWRSRGVLVAHLQEHCSAVNDIANSHDNSFFVSAYHDSTVKVWDLRKLEKDTSFRSRLTYHLEGSQALCIIMLRNSAQVVVACDGMIHMFYVHHISRALANVVAKYSGIADIKKKVL